MYINHQEYLNLGGTIPETSFKEVEYKAEKILDYFTHDRIKTLTNISPDIKFTMKEFIDKIYEFKSQDIMSNGVKSYSNGVERIEYRDYNYIDNNFNNSLYKIALINLPIELISAGIEDDK